MRSEILDLIYAGEGERLELKSSIRDPKLLSNLIASFANAQGGKIVIGVKEPPEVIGVDEALVRQIYEAAIHRLAPQPSANLSFVVDEGRHVAIIDVEPSAEIVLSEGRAFVRTGAITQLMAWTQIRGRLPSHPTASTIESLAKSIEKQSKLIEEMHEQISISNTWQSRWKERGVGFLLGVLASVVASVVVLAL